MNQFTRFIGVDLGGGKGKKTALAVLEKDRDGVQVTSLSPRPKGRPLYDQALVAALLSHPDDSVVCVDAPLTLPPCLRCAEPVCPGQDACIDREVVAMRALVRPQAGPSDRDGRRGKPTITPYTQRATELHLRTLGINARESLGQGMGPLAARAAHIRRALGRRYRLNHNLIEDYPRATLDLIGFREPYKKRVDRRIEILAAIPDLSFGPGVWREECRQSDHMFDAVICAYTGFLRARDGWQSPESAVDPVDPQGWIWIPPQDAAANGVRPAQAGADRPLPSQDERGLEASAERFR